MLGEGGKSRACGREQLQGNRPAPLMVHQESRSIGKPPKKPVVIYVGSPETIHVHPSEFMSLVQRLTGRTESSSSSYPPPPATANQRYHRTFGGDGALVNSGYPSSVGTEGVREEPRRFSVMNSSEASIRQEPARPSTWPCFQENNDVLRSVAEGSSLMGPGRLLPHGEYRPRDQHTPCAGRHSSAGRVVPPSLGQYIDVFCEVVQDI